MLCQIYIFIKTLIDFIPFYFFQRMASSICRQMFLSLTVLLLLFIHNSVPTSKDCPCALDLITKTADCSHRLLQYIPWCVASETERLDLSHNSLNYKPTQFQRLGELAWLDLLLNKAFTPGEETFSGLSQLNAVYLNGTSCQEIQGRYVSEPSNIARYYHSGIAVSPNFPPVSTQT